MGWKRSRSKSRGGFRRVAARTRQPTGWWRPGQLQLGQLSAGTLTATTLVSAGKDLMPQPAAVLDRKSVIRVIRVICRVILLVTGGGNAGNYTLHYGWRIADLNAAGTSAASGADPAMLNAVDKQEDWLYLKHTSVAIGAADAGRLVPMGDGGQNELVFDFKPGRKLEYGQGLCIVWSVVNLGAFGGGTTLNGYLTPEVLFGGVS